MNAYLLSHNGLGDNITMISAIRFLTQFYQKIFFICKDRNKENVKLFFNESVVVLPFNQNNEFTECSDIIKNVDIKDDILICGFHKTYLTSRINNPKLLEYKKNNDYKIRFSFIKKFYEDIGLDLSIYYNYFDISSSLTSNKLYQEISHYKIAFFHTQSSDGEINIENIISSFKSKSEYIVICANKNVYKLEEEEKFSIAAKYVNEKIAYYIDIIKNADVIHVIDSCFTCIVYPLQCTNKLIASECVIHPRN